MTARYYDALERLFARTTGAWKLGLERVSRLFELAGNPHLRYPVFHVAGTNGKGSTVATMATLLTAAGYRVGRYTSPHLVDFRERIVVDDKAIAPDDVVRWLEEWEPHAVEIGATFFETTTVMALDHFAHAGVDVAIVEVGLGGRLDATNVVNPVAATVTQIGFDHMKMLGNTLHEIAIEKAGIFKAGVPAILGDTDASVQDVLRARAIAAGATPIVAADHDWTVRNIEVAGDGTSFVLVHDGHERRLHTSLVGEFQAHNSATALATLRAAGGRWRAVEMLAEEHLGSVRLAGRFHRHGKYLFDVAHNPDGARALAMNIRQFGLARPVSALVTVLRDKDWQGILRAVGEFADKIVVSVAPTAPAVRAWSLGEVSRWAEAEGLQLRIEPDFDRALSWASAHGETVVLTGSFHTVGDAMERLQVDPLSR